jgi:hypothetical protein
MELDGAPQRAFEVEGSEVVVLNPDGRVARQKVPEDISPMHFRHVLAAVDVYWNDRGQIPTPSQARTLWPTIPLKLFQTIFATVEFKEALERRGISFAGGAGLSEKQATALAILTNPGDARSTTAKLKDLGVSYATFQNWMRQPLFSRMYRERTERVLEDIVPAAIVGLATNVESGNQRSIEFALKMSGRFDPDAVEVQNARQIVLTLVEAIEKHAPKDVREAILGELDGIMRATRVQHALKEIG